MVATEFNKGFVLILPRFIMPTNYIIGQIGKRQFQLIEYWKRDETLWILLTPKVKKGCFVNTMIQCLFI